MHPTTFFSGFRFPLFVTAVVVLAGGVFGDRPRAQQNTISVRDTNFDIRSASPEVAAAYRNQSPAGVSLRDAGPCQGRRSRAAEG